MKIVKSCFQFKNDFVMFFALFSEQFTSSAGDKYLHWRCYTSLPSYATITLKLVEALSELVRSHGKLLSNKINFFLRINLHTY